MSDGDPNAGMVAVTIIVVTAVAGTLCLLAASLFMLVR